MILALQTDGQTTRAWLFEGMPKDYEAAAAISEPAATLNWESGRQLSDELLSHIASLLKNQNKELNDLAGIIIFSGPGSFTSLRIGHTVANALADTLGIVVVGALGENWITEGFHRLARTEPGRPALPYYGGEANITKPNA